MGERYLAALREPYVNALATLHGRYVSASIMLREGTIAYRRLPEYNKAAQICYINPNASHYKTRSNAVLIININGPAFAAKTP